MLGPEGDFITSPEISQMFGEVAPVKPHHVPALVLVLHPDLSCSCSACGSSASGWEPGLPSSCSWSSSGLEEDPWPATSSGYDTVRLSAPGDTFLQSYSYGEPVCQQPIVSLLLQVFSQLQSVLGEASVSLHLVEVSPALSQLQAENLTGQRHQTAEDELVYLRGETATGLSVSWYRRLDDVPRGKRRLEQDRIIFTLRAMNWLF